MKPAPPAWVLLAKLPVEVVRYIVREFVMADRRRDLRLRRAIFEASNEFGPMTYREWNQRNQLNDFWKERGYYRGWYVGNI